MGAMAAALCVAGCGVGVGGTGTGEDLVAFGATAASVCGAQIATALSCSTSSISEGSARRLFVDTDSGGRVLMTIDGNQVDYEVRCAGLSYSGTWGRSSTGVQRYFGSVVRSSERNKQLALLDVALPNSGLGGNLLAWLKDANEQTLLPVVTMRPVTAFPTVLPACPP